MGSGQICRMFLEPADLSSSVSNMAKFGITKVEGIISSISLVLVNIASAALTNTNVSKSDRKQKAASTSEISRSPFYQRQS